MIHAGSMGLARFAFAVAAYLLLTPPASAPVWSSPTRETSDPQQGSLLGQNVVDHPSDGMLKASEKIRPLMMIVGHPGRGHASAFVISRKHRLLATAAHVADHASEFPGEPMIAFVGGRDVPFHIDKIWYHPGIVRKLDVGLFVRSDDPSDGEVVPGVPDVAVLQLSDGGPELPEECSLATARELLDIEGKEVGVLGYPEGEGNAPLDAQGASKAALAVGRVVKSVDPADQGREGAGAPWSKQWIVDTASSGPGCSGAPIFLADGKVIGIRRGGVEDVHDPLKPVKYASGFRIDCLVEVLAHHKLLPMVLGAEMAGFGHVGEWAPDPKLPNFRRAVQLIREADALGRIGRVRDAVDRCNAAIVLFPGYGMAFLARGHHYLGYCVDNWEKLGSVDRCKFAMWAQSDLRYGMRLIPDATICPRSEYYYCDIYMGLAFNEIAYYYKTIKLTTDTLQNKDLVNYERSVLLNCRAEARFLIGDSVGSMSDYKASLEVLPGVPRWQYPGDSSHRAVGTQ
jgi:Trypsin-like peptidase domain